MMATQRLPWAKKSVNIVARGTQEDAATGRKADKATLMV